MYNLDENGKFTNENKFKSERIIYSCIYIPQYIPDYIGNGS